MPDFALSLIDDFGLFSKQNKKYSKKKDLASTNQKLKDELRREASQLIF
jgi:hypothetical protein